MIGAVLYFIVSWLSFAFFQPSISNITFRPATVILVLFGVLYGPWVGLFAGLFGKTLIDTISGWGFNWYGSIAYGLIDFVPGLTSIVIKDFRSSRNLLKTILWGGLGVLIGTLFLFVVEIYLSDINLKVAFLDFFLPEFVGNLTVVIILLPLLLIVIRSLNRSK